MSQIETVGTKRLNFSRLMKVLRDIKNHTSYYVGGTLFIDFKDMPNVGLNLSGRGFTYYSEPGKWHETKFVMTHEMTELVRAIYLEHKGRTAHYESTVKN